MRAVLAGNKVAVEAAIEELPRNGGDINAEGSGGTGNRNLYRVTICHQDVQHCMRQPP